MVIENKIEKFTKEKFNAFKNGDEIVFGEIFNVNYGKVKSFVLNLVKEETEAEDIIQDVFVKLWINRKTIRSYESFYGFMYKLAKNEAFDFLAVNKKKVNFVYEIPEYMYGRSFPDPLDEYHAMELEMIISLIVSKMPEQRRKIFCMSRNEGMSYDEISKALNISKKTIESHINTALNQIRRTIYILILLTRYFEGIK